MNRTWAKVAAGIATGAVLAAGIAAAGEGAPAAAGTNQAAAALGKPQTTCPVMEGSAIKKSIYTDYKGKRIYFCCGGCPKMFAKDPEKYMKKMQDAGVVLQDTPKE